jgi:signal transduction histidine kinase
LLTRALANVIRNAIQHAGNNGPITMEAAEQPGDVTIVVSDSGPGVPE